MRRLVVVLATALAAGCGYIGDTLPPALNIATRINDLRAVQYGDRLLIEFTIPEKTTEDLPMRSVGEIDLRVGPGPAPFDYARWAAGARKVPVSAAEPGAAETQVPSAEWKGQEIVIGVRLVNAKGRASDWSNLVVRRIVEPVEKPAELRAEPDPAGVRLNWRSEAKSFRVYRKMADSKDRPALLESGQGDNYFDKSTEYGKSYQYFVQTTRDGAESEVSDGVSITPRDVFPPAVPSGITGVPGAGTIELVWERNTEPDLRGYRIYRAAENAEFQALGDLVDAPNYSDRAVEAGKKYRYAITSVDQAGNESAKSAPVEVTAR